MSSISNDIARLAPVVVNPIHKQNATGDGWAASMKSDFQPFLKSFKFVLPNANTRPVTLNFGMRMPAWYDIKGLSPESEEDEQGIEAATKYVHQLIEMEITGGTPSNRILLGGFSMGAALAIYAGLTCEHTLGGIICFSGFLLQRHKIPGKHKANINVPIFLGHGENDFLVPFAFGQMTHVALKQFNKNVVFHSYPIEHTSSPAELKDAVNFILSNVSGG